LTCFRVDTSKDLGEASVKGRLFLFVLGGCVEGRAIELKLYSYYFLNF